MKREEGGGKKEEEILKQKDGEGKGKMGGEGIRKRGNMKQEEGRRMKEDG